MPSVKLLDSTWMISVEEQEIFTLLHHWWWPSYCQWRSFLPWGLCRDTWRRWRWSTVNVWERSTAVRQRSSSVRTNWVPRGPKCPCWLLSYRASESWRPNKKRSPRLRCSWKVSLLQLPQKGHRKKSWMWVFLWISLIHNPQFDLFYVDS